MAVAMVSALSVQPAAADPGEQAVALVDITSRQLFAISGSGDATQEKHRRLHEAIDLAVDVENVARFCLGRFWDSATSDQKAQYLEHFRELLIQKIVAHVGDYQGAQITIGTAEASGDSEVVATWIARPDNPTMPLDWVVSTSTGVPRIVDLRAGGTSLRLTQRAELLSYLTRHQNSVDQLNEGMRKMVAWNQN